MILYSTQYMPLEKLRQLAQEEPHAWEEAYRFECVRRKAMEEDSMTPEEKLVRVTESALKSYDAKRDLNEREPPQLEKALRELREGVAEYRREHPREDEAADG